MNIARVCDIMAWENKNLGMLDAEGFTVPIALNTHSLGEWVLLRDEDLTEPEEIDLESLKEVRF